MEIRTGNVQAISTSQDLQICGCLSAKIIYTEARQVVAYSVKFSHESPEHNHGMTIASYHYKESGDY